MHVRPQHFGLSPATRQILSRTGVSSIVAVSRPYKHVQSIPAEMASVMCGYLCMLERSPGRQWLQGSTRQATERKCVYVYRYLPACLGRLFAFPLPPRVGVENRRLLTYDDLASSSET